jgi:hypothetical protein
MITQVYCRAFKHDKATTTSFSYTEPMVTN